MPASTALYVLNHKRRNLADLESRFGLTITIEVDESVASTWREFATPTWIDERLVVDVTYFEADLRDEIVTTFPAPNFVATPVNQDGKSKRRGVELTMNARVTDDIDSFDFNTMIAAMIEFVTSASSAE